MSEQAEMDKQEQKKQARLDRKYSTGRDWSHWKIYDNVATGLRGYWYPVQWSSEVNDKPQALKVCGEKIMLMRNTDGICLRSS